MGLDGQPAAVVMQDESQAVRLANREIARYSQRQAHRERIQRLREVNRQQDSILSELDAGSTIENIASLRNLTIEKVTRAIAKATYRRVALQKVHDQVALETQQWSADRTKAPVLVISMPPESNRAVLFDRLCDNLHANYLKAPAAFIDRTCVNIMRLDTNTLRADSIVTLIDRAHMDSAKILVMVFVSATASVRVLQRQLPLIDRIIVPYPPVNAIVNLATAATTQA